jgi:phosphoribosyl-ATP pyrophosphohydrolase
VEDTDEQATTGQLTGLAEDQDTFLVEVDVEARQDESYMTSHTGRVYNSQGARQLRDIVQNSTERWMLANDGADEEYYSEMSKVYFPSITPWIFNKY